jgi:TfoX/Sxy family transcriptional regulator of competence genes
MAYDEKLAARIRGVLDGRSGVTERKMFGGLAFLLDGKMFCGIARHDLMVRVGAERYEDALGQPHVRPMDFTGRPMKGYVFVGTRGLASDSALASWVERGIDAASQAPGLRISPAAADGTPPRPTSGTAASRKRSPRNRNPPRAARRRGGPAPGPRGKRS